ncbi:MAG: nuclear transport factor 2 family protein [Microthrixaceae bacterium]|nr:nuclear transport factor 2 family protein [Microthrixaceae bacterium]MCB1010467.1 nuclear transport factor 2 family protein [Microthrixaceae bacterium]MCB9387387.1 nuclear transport factor 2 family protein [Microthrixaceae bacterium]MCO5322261.1 nuclear transport factor 2 family protein [Microthrixaceae bacterium]
MTADAREIENLIYAYAERIDAGDLHGLGELFDGARLVAAPGVVLEGADAVRRLYERSTRIHADGTPRTRHMTTNVTIEVRPDRAGAEARSAYTVFQQTDALPLQPIISGRYHDTFVLDGDRWRFGTREIFVDLTGNLGEHLLFEL